MSVSVQEESQWDDGQLNVLWEQLGYQVNPFLQVLSMSGSLFRLFDEAAKRFVAQKFMQHVMEPVMYFRDGSGQDRYFLGAPRHFISGGGMVLRPAGLEPFWIMRPEMRIQTATICPPPLPAKPTKIPRPPNAYILYRKERHNLVKEANPGITNNEISQVLGRAWNLESREIRQKYKEMSEQIKQALLEKHPDYQYKPRKSSEKKRRSRRANQGVAVVADDDAAMDETAMAEEVDTTNAV